jgi:SAM-dependent methyltransferase
MFLAVVEAPCFSERFELAAACHAIIWEDGITGGLAPEGQTHFPCWGTLARLYEWFGKYGATTRLLLGRHEEIRDALLSHDGVPSPQGGDTEEIITNIASTLRTGGSVARRLSFSAIGGRPFERQPSDYLETMIFANQLEQVQIDRIEYQTADVFETKLMVKGLNKGHDDASSDYHPFDHDPEREMAIVDREIHRDVVDLVIKQRQAPLRGQCIELGCGHGYFSAMLSREPQVDNVVALNISAASILRRGPVIWDRLKPDWDKLRYVIADMNSLDAGFGTYDTVVFSGSLHHSSDIPRSLQIANSLLKTGGVVALHSEHYDARFLSPKSRKDSVLPHTIDDFSEILKQSGFRPVVFRYVLPGNRFPRLKRFVFSVWPFKYINGWFFFHSFVMLGIKR